MSNRPTFESATQQRHTLYPKFSNDRNEPDLREYFSVTDKKYEKERNEKDLK